MYIYIGTYLIDRFAYNSYMFITVTICCINYVINNNKIRNISTPRLISPCSGTTTAVFGNVK